GTVRRERFAGGRSMGAGVREQPGGHEDSGKASAAANHRGPWEARTALFTRFAPICRVLRPRLRLACRTEHSVAIPQRSSSVADGARAMLPHAAGASIRTEALLRLLSAAAPDPLHFRAAAPARTICATAQSPESRLRQCPEVHP